MERIGDSITIYNANCIDLLKRMADKEIYVEAIITDPPYGINFKYETYQDTEDNWKKLMDEFVPLAKEVSQTLVMPCCAIARLRWWYTRWPPDWMVAWYKGSPGHRSYVGFNDWEPHLVWGKPKKQIHDYFQTPLVIEDNGHPCPKPVAYTDWLVSRFASKGGTVLDPFMGSGTTGVSCAKLGRKFYGIEMDPKYYAIAAQRIRDVGRQGTLFDIVKEDEDV